MAYPQFCALGLGSVNPVDDGHPKYGKQRTITKYFLAHPYLGALWSALVIGSWTALLVQDARAVVPAFIGMFALVSALWRPGGPARRREERLYPPPPDSP